MRLVQAQRIGWLGTKRKFLYIYININGGNMWVIGTNSI
jgi:hypothetical protein